MHVLVNKFMSSHAIRYCVIGLSLSFFFMTAALLGVSFAHNATIHETFLKLSSWFWLVMVLSPFFLGIIFFSLGRKQDRLEEQIKLVEQQERAERKAQIAEAEKIGKYGSWDMDLRTQQVHWSDGFYDLLGLAPNEIPSTFKNYSAFVLPSEQEISMREFHQYMKDKVEVFESEISIRRKDGQLRRFKGTGKIFYDAHGTPIRVIGTSQDITELASALNEAATFKRALDRSALVAITDAKGTIQYANEAFSRVSGYSNEELVGQNHRILKSGMMGEGFFKQMWKTISRGEVWRGDICNRAKDGSLYWVDTAIIPTLDRWGEIVGYTAIRNEITSRKKMEEQLWAINEMRRAILDSANYIVISTDTNGVVQTYNKAAEKMLGYDPAEVIGQKTLSYFHVREEIEARAIILSYEFKEDVQPGLDVFTLKTSRYNKPDENEWTYVRKDKSTFPVRSSMTCLYGSKGELVGYLNIADDISESKRVHAQLVKANQAAVAALKSKSEFFANMSHEIRTPLNGIIGMCDLLMSEVKDREIYKKLEIVEGSGKNLLNLINDILDLSKMEAKKIVLENEPFQVHSVINETLELLKPKAHKKGLEIFYEPSQKIPDWIKSDITRFRQILINLVENAIKFTHQGKITIASHLEGSLEDSLFLKFSVTDTGIGIPMHINRKIFESFVQVDASTTRKYGGTGLGLSISKGLCELLGGTIWVESVPGQGSTFFFTMKASRVTHKVESKKIQDFEGYKKLMSSFPSINILVAEDNHINRLVVTGMLGKLGQYADVANNGLEVMELIKNKKYDLILMDCHMPEMDGFATARAICQQIPSASRPSIVALTASTMKHEIDMCFASGMEAVVSKPIEVKSLFDVLIKIYQKSAS